MACHMCVGLNDGFTLFSNLEKMRTPKALECAPQGTPAFGSYPQTVDSVTNYLKISVRGDAEPSQLLTEARIQKETRGKPDRIKRGLMDGLPACEKRAAAESRMEK